MVLTPSPFHPSSAEEVSPPSVIRLVLIVLTTAQVTLFVASPATLPADGAEGDGLPVQTSESPPKASPIVDEALALEEGLQLDAAMIESDRIIDLPLPQETTAPERLPSPQPIEMPAPAETPEALVPPPPDPTPAPLPSPSIGAPLDSPHAINSGEFPVLPFSPSISTGEPVGLEATHCDGLCIDGSCSTCRGQSVASHWTPWQNLDRRLPDWDLRRFSIGNRFRRQRSHDRGLGYERVMFAPNVLDTAIGTPHVGLHYQLDAGLRTPDRAEYYWGAAAPDEISVNAQDLHFRMAVGNDKAMALTQYTLRSLDPDRAHNTTGFGDMVVGAQSLLLDGKRTKLATIFRTYLATGNAQRGLGTGHTSLEHGLLVRQCLSPETYWFGEIKYWLPIKGTSPIAGDVLTTGWGVASIAAESDVFALIPTFEMRTLSFLFGGQTRADGTVDTRVDGTTAVELYPGARFVLDPQSDWGLLEFGFSTGITVADSNWFDSRIVFDLRLIH